MSNPSHKTIQSIPVLREFSYFLRPHKLTFGLVVFLSIILSCLNMAVPYALKLAVDILTAAEHFERLFFISFGVLAIYGIKNICYYNTKIRIVALAEKIAFDLRVSLMGHLHRLSIAYHRENKPGQLANRLIQDVESIKEFLASEFIKLFINVLMIIVGVLIIIVLNPILAVAALLLLPLDILIYRYFRTAITDSAKEAKGETANVSGNLIEQFSGIETLKSAASEDKEQENFAFSMERGMKAKLKERKFYLLQKVSADMMSGLSLLILFLFGGYLVFNEHLTTAEFVAFYAYIGMLYPEVIKLVSDLGKFSSARASFDRVYEILGTEPDVKEMPDARPHRIKQGEVEFKNIRFSFSGKLPPTGAPSASSSGKIKNKPLFNNLNLKIAAGEHVLISGPTGCGKSTMLNLIPRFFDPSAGCIKIDNLENKQYTLKSLRAQIGYVFQSTFIFNISVLENIRYARPDATEAEVAAAARFSNADEFINTLPKKYMTTLGVGGIQLSSGERQKIGLARAFLKNPRIFILDEAMGALDEVSQSIALDNLMRMAEGRTMIIVSHNPSTFPQMHREIKMNELLTAQ